MFKNISKSKRDNEKFLTGIILFFGLFSLFICIGYIVYIRNINTDFQLHAEMCKLIAEGKLEYTGNFLLYFLVNFFSGYSKNFDINFLVLIVIVAVFFAFKGILVFSTLVKETSVKKSIFFTISSVFYFGVPVLFFIWNKYFYISNQTPNVFHSSSTLMVYSLSLLLFYAQIKLWVEKRGIVLIYFLIVVMAFIKPSFLFTFFLSTPIICLIYFRNFKDLLLTSFTSIFILIILSGQFFFIFYLQKGSFYKEESHVVISFFDFWKFFYAEKYYLFSLAGGFLFPISFFILSLRIKKSISFYYAILLVFFSILIFIFISETGGRRFHGNFGWQITLSYFVLMVVCLQEMFRLEKADLLQTWKKYILYSVFGLHVLCGFIYLYRFLILKDYT